MEVILAIAAGMLSLPLVWAVHLGLDRCCVLHARRWCKRRGLEILRWRWATAFDATGIKTEFTVVEVDCRERDGKRIVHRFLVWISRRRTPRDRISFASWASLARGR